MTKELEEKSTTPLPNDPGIFSKYAENLGLDLNSATFYDVLGFVPHLYSMTPQPVYAVILLYSVGKKGGPLDTRFKQPIPDDQIPSPQPWFTLQTVHNSCGLLSILHAILNNLDHVKLKPDSWLANFAKETANLTPEQRARVIHNDDTLFSVHENAAKQSDDQTKELPTDHYITFINFAGKLWELDGKKPQPICHGETQNLLADSIAVIKEQIFPHLKNTLFAS